MPVKFEAQSESGLVSYVGSAATVSNPYRIEPPKIKSFRTLRNSASLIAMAAAVGWSGNAQALGDECGVVAPGGTADCNAVSYPSGITYAVDDLTVNIGAAAGQAGAVTIGDPGVDVSGYESETVNVTGDVTISTTTGSAHGVYVRTNDDSVDYSVSATVYSTADITTTGNIADGIRGRSWSTSIFNYDASATTTITSTGSINTSGNAANGILGTSYTTSSDPSAQTSTATTIITSSGPVTVTNEAGDTGNLDGIEGDAEARAQGEPTSAVAAVVISSYADVNVSSADADGSTAWAQGIDAFTYAFANVVVSTIYDATATATSTVTSDAAINVSTGDSAASPTGSADGIYGESIARALGSTATAVTTITSYDAITVSTGDSAASSSGHAQGIDARSQAYAHSFDADTAVATATTIVTSTDDITVTSGNAYSSSGFVDGISGESSAVAFNNYLYGGESTAVATTIVSSTGNITVASGTATTGGTGSVDGIDASSYSRARGSDSTALTAVTSVGDISATSGNTLGGSHSGAVDGIDAYAGSLSSGEYATSGATTVITSVGNIVATSGDSAASGSGTPRGIDGFASARAFSHHYNEEASYAVATALTSITSTGDLTVTGGDGGTHSHSATGISGGSSARADGINHTPGFGFVIPDGYAAANAYATATTVIGSEGNLVVSSGDGASGNSGSARGIDGSSYAEADAYIEASATALTLITASGSIAASSGDSYGSHSQSGDAVGISGESSASAFSYGDLYGTATATATTVITSYADITATTGTSYNTYGDTHSGGEARGIDGESSAVAYGSTATALTAVTSSGDISVTAGAALNPPYTVQGVAVGIRAKSFASSYGYDGASSTATSVVEASGSITTSGGYESHGIVSTSYGEAASAGPATLALAVGTALVTNDATINVSANYSAGIVGYSKAYASNSGLFGAAISYATTYINNTGNITVTGDYSAGILGVSLAGASGEYTSPNALTVIVSGGQVSASGYGSTGIAGVSYGSHVEIVVTGGSVTGGTGVDAAGISSYSTGTTSVTNYFGTVGSLNDRVLNLNSIVANDVTNVNLMVGFMELSAYANSVTNAPTGRWIARGGDSDFTTTGGPSVLVNAGKIVVVGDQTWSGLDTVVNPGTISFLETDSAGFEASTLFETLHLSGDFVGGGTVAVDVGINALQEADVLDINGNVVGLSSTVDADAFGIPAQATSGNGILVVDVEDGTTNGDDFVLEGNTAGESIVAGAYEYKLNLIPGAGGAGSWFLQSEIFDGIYEYPAIASGVQNIWNQTLLPLHERLPGLYPGGTPTISAQSATPILVADADGTVIPTEPATRPSGIGVWARFVGAGTDVNPAGAGAEFDQSMYLAQIGGDYSLDVGDGDLLLGAFGGYVDSKLEFDASASEVQYDGTTWGGYATYLNGPNHVDMVIKADFIETEFNSPFTGVRFEEDLTVWGFSGEVGHIQELANRQYFAPRLQVQYSSAESFSFFDLTGNEIRVSRSESLIGSIGARYGILRDWGTTRVAPYVDAAISHEFAGDQDALITGVTPHSNLGGTTYEVGVGSDFVIDDTYSLFVDVDYLIGQRQDGIRGLIGGRAKF